MIDVCVKMKYMVQCTANYIIIILISFLDRKHYMYLSLCVLLHSGSLGSYLTTCTFFLGLCLRFSTNKVLPQRNNGCYIR